MSRVFDLLILLLTMSLFPVSCQQQTPQIPADSVIDSNAASIVVNTETSLGKINPEIFGTNQRYNKSGNGMWNPGTGDAFPAFNKVYDDVGFTTFRYPGGTVANLFHWKRSIGPLNQRTKNFSSLDGGPTDTDFGLDEALRYCEAHGSTLVYMYGAGAGNTKDAADLIEYLNTPNDGSNPNRGIDWASVRAANGHPKPYNVKYFEIGNEMNLKDQKYWMEGESDKTLQQKYTFGDTVTFTRQPVAAYDDNSAKAALGDGKPGQVKYAMYPPINSGTESIYIDDTVWTRVDSFDKQGNRDVYTVDYETGKITFGDGINGNIPKYKSNISITYNTRHDGFVDYYREMKKVDPNIRVYSCLSDSGFFKLMGSEHPYDGVIIHAYTPKTFAGNSLEDFHDKLILQPDKKGELVDKTWKEMRLSVGEKRANEVDIPITEYGVLSGGTYPANYQLSLDMGLYVAQSLINWAELGVPHAEKHCTIGGDVGVIGPGPDFLETATARVFKMFTHMTGTTRIDSQITNNPVRQIAGSKDALKKLKVMASRDDKGSLYLMVVNSDRVDAVTAQVNFQSSAQGLKLKKGITVWTLNGADFVSYNTKDQPDNVKIETGTIPEKKAAFPYTFPAHSITAFKLE